MGVGLGLGLALGLALALGSGQGWGQVRVRVRVRVTVRVRVRVRISVRVRSASRPAHALVGEAEIWGDKGRYAEICGNIAGLHTPWWASRVRAAAASPSRVVAAKRRCPSGSR